ncbi:class I SAM-dependent methyltransferase [Stenomitos frigidus]|uniref:SAM-dependent methyltransferase n=1 Tax=Stenomitos frigidus ULC18 TaxID=2107698 RepID=A0A2T1E9I8_9CYAN|nr:class I SAM-dependent methyltransferase [Stenomitos frigidus]PSB29412.1 SAM-dependent methyltransferase [Stenomitos frigidus ULC18]
MQTEPTPLHAMNPLCRFSDRAEDYAKYRPSYPTEAITAVLSGLGEPAHLTAADIGAGTGISARLLADRGLHVWAIEPNAAMQQAALSHPRVTFQAGTAEETGLAAEAIDLVTCFQSFHWFEPSKSLTEFRRLLRTSGRLALIWNDRDQNDPFTAQYTQLIRVASDQHPAESCHIRTMEAQSLASSSLFQNFRHHKFTYRHPVDLQALIGRVRSTSYLPQTGAIYEQLVADITQLYEQWIQETGAIDLVHRTIVFLAERGEEGGFEF